MDIENYCGVVSTAKFIYIKAYDAYSINLPLIEATKLGVLLGKAQNGLVKLGLEIMVSWVAGKAWVFKYS
jgi:hypothetical protein